MVDVFQPSTFLLPNLIVLEYVSDASGSHRVLLRLVFGCFAAQHDCDRSCNYPVTVSLLCASEFFAQVAWSHTAVIEVDVFQHLGQHGM